MEKRRNSSIKRNKKKKTKKKKKKKERNETHNSINYRIQNHSVSDTTYCSYRLFHRYFSRLRVLGERVSRQHARTKITILCTRYRAINSTADVILIRAEAPIKSAINYAPRRARNRWPTPADAISKSIRRRCRKIRHRARANYNSFYGQGYFTRCNRANWKR